MKLTMSGRRAGWAAVLNACAALLFLAPVDPAWASIQLAVTALIPPATALAPRAALGLAVAFTLGYFILALKLGVEWQVLASTARSESFATHLLIPLLVVGGLAHGTRLLERLDAERVRTEAVLVPVMTPASLGLSVA